MWFLCCWLFYFLDFRVETFLAPFASSLANRFRAEAMAGAWRMAGADLCPPVSLLQAASSLFQPQVPCRWPSLAQPCGWWCFLQLSDTQLSLELAPVPIQFPLLNCLACSGLSDTGHAEAEGFVLVSAGPPCLLRPWGPGTSLVV